MSNTALKNSADDIHVKHDNSVLIQATSLNRYYGDYQAVRDFNLTLNKGEVLGLLGPNGAGKSSTMQMLTGNISPSSGDVFINGINLIEEPELAKSAIGYLPEQPPVYRDMTVGEYLLYCSSLRGLAKPQRKILMAEASERCGLQDVQKKLIGNLSKGFQQRVGIAQAILHKPDVVILDEPTVGLDPLQINQIRQLVRELGEDHAVILSTHILPEVQAVCDRVQIINKGETVFADTFDKLADQESVSEIVVSFANPVDVDSLSQLADVSQVEVLSSQDKQNSYRLSYEGTSDSSAVFQLAVKKGWDLIELSPQTKTLEQIFMHLVHSESETKPTISKGTVDE